MWIGKTSRSVLCKIFDQISPFVQVVGFNDGVVWRERGLTKNFEANQSEKRRLTL